MVGLPQPGGRFPVLHHVVAPVCAAEGEWFCAAAGEGHGLSVLVTAVLAAVLSTELSVAGGRHRPHVGGHRVVHGCPARGHPFPSEVPAREWVELAACVAVVAQLRLALDGGMSVGGGGVHAVEAVSGAPEAGGEGLAANLVAGMGRLFQAGRRLLHQLRNGADVCAPRIEE